MIASSTFSFNFPNGLASKAISICEWCGSSGAPVRMVTVERSGNGGDAPWLHLPRSHHLLISTVEHDTIQR